MGLYHRAQGNHHGAVTLLTKGIALLRPYEPSCHGLDVAALVQDATIVLHELEDLGPPGVAAALAPAPVIRWVDGSAEANPA